MTAGRGGAIGANIAGFSRSEVANVAAGRPPRRRHRDHDDAQRQHCQTHKLENQHVHGKSPNTNR
jgi:hypothetical protein